MRVEKFYSIKQSTTGNISASLIFFVIGAISLFISLVVFSLDDQIVKWAINIYSRKGDVTLTGYHRIIDTLERAKLGFVAGGLGCVIFALVLWKAERAISETNINKVSRQAWPESIFTTGVLTTIILFGFGVVRFTIGMAHVGDSLWCDELYTVKNFGLQPIYSIFGFSKSNLPNNHILNSLLVKFSLASGLGSEVGLRIWNFMASILTIPAAYYLGMVLKLKRASLLIFLAIISTSALIDRFGTQARGYGLAILFATLSIALHLDCFSRPSKLRFVSLICVNMLLILSNLATLPLVCGEILHLVIEGLYPRSQARMEGYLAYNQHLLSLALSLCLVAASYIFLLPFIFLNSTYFTSYTPLSPTVILNFLSVMLNHQCNLTLSVILLLILVIYAVVRKKDKIAKRASVALYSILLCGMSAPILMHVVEGRAFAYLHTTLIAILVMAESGLRRWRFTLPVTVALVICFCVYSVYQSVNRVPIQDYRGMIQEAQKIAGGRKLWTSGFASEGVEYYGDTVSIPTEFPDQPSIYLSFFDWYVENDELQKLVKSRCRVRSVFPSEKKMAIYECP